MFHHEMNFLFLSGRKCSFLCGCTKATFSRFSDSWADGKITKYISRGRGKVFFTLCLKSDRIKESLSNVSNRSFFPLVEEKSLKLKRGSSP